MAYFTPAQILEIAELSISLATTDTLKGQLFSPRINPKLFIILDMETAALRWAYNQSSAYPNIQWVANYVYDLCGVYALRARYALNPGGTPVIPVTPGGDDDCNGVEYITSPDFEADGKTVSRPDWAGKQIKIFWNNIPKFIKEGVDWIYIVGGGFEIIIPGFNATASGPDEDVEMYVFVGCYSPGTIIYSGSNVTLNQATFSGDGITTVFQIEHLATGTPEYVIEPVGADSSGQYETTANGTYITITYNVAPPVGTDNIVINWAVST